jgi:nicotinamide mononucleotide (NMN) deamidase PncC
MRKSDMEATSNRLKNTELYSRNTLMGLHMMQGMQAWWCCMQCSQGGAAGPGACDAQPAGSAYVGVSLMVVHDQPCDAQPAW